MADLPGALSSDEARKVFDYLMMRARTDLVFRRALLDDPRRALERELELELPPAFRLRFVENEGADLTIVLPDPVAVRPAPPRGPAASGDGASEGMLGVLYRAALDHLNPDC